MTKTKSQKLRRKNGEKQGSKPSQKQNPPRKSGITRSETNRVVAPTAVGIQRITDRAKITNLKDGSVMVRHREYVGEVSGQTAFGLVSYIINPGVAILFPWLSAIAQRYESYRFRKLRFCYETESPTATAGTVVLAVDYDPNDPAPTSKQIALQYESAVRCPPWTSVEHVSLSHNLNKRKSYFVRTPGAAVADPDVLDVGNLFVVTQGQAISNIVGELYVDYEVELITPALASGSQGVSGEYNNSNGVAIATPFGTQPGTQHGDVYAFTFIPTAFFFNVGGEYMVTFDVTGVNLTSVSAGISSGILQILDPTIINSTLTRAVVSYSARVAPAAELLLTVAGTSMAGITVRIAQYTFNNQ